jgi:hypothetical protein
MGLLAQRDTAANSVYPLTDGLGNVRNMTDATATPIQSPSYAPNGKRAT